MSLRVDHESEHGRVAVAFARALVGGRFDEAHGMLSSGMRAGATPEALREAYEGMIEYGDGAPFLVELMATMESWPAREPDDLGWAYVAIAGDGFGEAVTVVVAREASRAVVRAIEWGRP